MSDRPTTRRDLMRPVQLLGLAFVAAVFAGVVTLISMGFFQDHPADQTQRALFVAIVVTGITFIVTLVVIALLVLAVDPAQVAKTVDRPVLLPPEAESAGPAAAPGAEESAADGGEAPDAPDGDKPRP